MAKSFGQLSRACMRRLRPGQTITEHGIRFERLGTGDGIFTVNIMVDRQRIHRTVGRESEGVTRTTAEEYIASIRQEAREGRLNLPRRKFPITLGAAAQQYLARISQEGGRDIDRKRQRLEKNLVPFLGSRPLSQLTNSDIERYKVHRLSQPIQTRKSFRVGEILPTNKPATVNRDLATLSHLLSKAEEWGWVNRRVTKVQKFSESNRRLVYLTPVQAGALLEAAKRDRNAQIYTFILIGLRTGMRKSEILSIERDHVDLAQASIYIPKAKAGERLQPMTPELVDHLRAYMETLPPRCRWVFPSIGASSGHTIDIRKAFVRSVIAAGLDPKQVVRHTLRHTAVTQLVQAGVDLPTVKRISGHKTMVMVERYAHQSGAHIAVAMEKLDAQYRPAGPAERT